MRGVVSAALVALLSGVGCRDATQILVVVDSSHELSPQITRVQAWSSTEPEPAVVADDAHTFVPDPDLPFPFSYAIVPNGDSPRGIFVHLEAKGDDARSRACVSTEFVDGERVVIVSRFDRWCTNDCPPCREARPCSVSGANRFDAIERCGTPPRDGGAGNQDAGARDAGRTPDAGTPRDAGRNPDSDMPDGGPQRDGGLGPDGGGSSGRDGGTPQPLAAAVVRYFFDEGPPGDPEWALDYGGAPPMNLARNVGGAGPSYVEDSDGRSVAWTAAGVLGSFSAPASAMVITQLEGTQQFTLEIVLRNVSEVANDSGLIHLGTELETDVALRINPLYFVLQFEGSMIRWNRSINPLPDPVVLTVVADSSKGNLKNRVRLFVDGTPSRPLTFSLPQNASVSLSANVGLTVGNLPAGYASVLGKIGYVAIYDRALSVAEIMNNAATLRVAHDSP